MASTQDVIRLARKHLGEGPMDSSARLCLADAMAEYEPGEYQRARVRATRSLGYSVGYFHPDTIRALGSI
jgi:hypothetical protein